MHTQDWCERCGNTDNSKIIEPICIYMYVYSDTDIYRSRGMKWVNFYNAVKYLFK